MRICMFTNTYRPHVGGVARSVETFTADLREAGHQVLVIAPVFPDQDDTGETDLLRVPAIQNFNGSDFSVRIPVPNLIDAALDRFDPEIIHSHHPYLLGDAALRGAWRRTLPLIFTHHTLYEEYTHYVSADSDTMRQFAVNLCTEYANRCTRAIAPSRSILHLMRERGMTIPIEVIPTGVDLDFFAEGRGRRFRTQHGVPEDAFVVGHVGRLAPEKNLDFLAGAVSRYLRRNAGALFLVVGDGPSADTMAERFRKSGVEGQVVMAGRQTGSALADAYQAMNLFVFSSRSETQGMVVAEAMACAKPVIALDASGVREVVSDGENGRLLSSNADESAFAEAVAAAATHPGRIARWKKGALRTARELDRRSSAEALTTLYRSASSEAAARRNHRMEMEILAPWDEMLGGVKAEWELLAQKAAALAHTIKDCV